MILVTPTGDDHERQHGSLFIAGDERAQKVYRGVVEDVGEHVEEGIEIGNVAHYLDFIELDTKHLIPVQRLIAFEDAS